VRWFKRKPTPFGPDFSIHVETPPNPVDKQHFEFIVPDWYYGQLISLQCNMYVHTPLMNPVRCNLGYVRRGSHFIQRWFCHVGTKSGETYAVMMWPTAHDHWTNLAVPKPWQARLPPDCYVYPGDVVGFEFTVWDVNDWLRNFILTFKIWET